MFEKGDIMETIRNVDVNRLHDFENHPFKVEMNTELCELMRSIEKEGVLVPLLVRTSPYGDEYEVISGHRRKEAAIWAGETKVPVVVRELDMIRQLWQWLILTCIGKILNQARKHLRIR